MKHEMKLATIENLVTALCLAAGIVLIGLALYTLIAVKTVHTDRPLAGDAVHRSGPLAAGAHGHDEREPRAVLLPSNAATLQEGGPRIE